MPARPIGVFDSGVGGLTVLAALRRRLPDEEFLYLGDTARLPYGSKSPESVRRYARQAAGKLVERGVKLLVIACNTASAVAVEDLRDAFAPLPVVGVIEPGAEAACAASKSGHVLVLGTEGTIHGGAYQRAMLTRRPQLQIDAIACPLFVALAEEGWVEGPIPEAVARRYLDELRDHVDTVVLGCTHFPLLERVLARICGPGVTLVDSAETTARAVARTLGETGLGRADRPEGTAGGSIGSSASSPPGWGFHAGESDSECSASPARSDTLASLGPEVRLAGCRFLATDAPARFARVGAVFLGHPIRVDDVELVDL